jgi:hypothetical protein
VTPMEQARINELEAEKKQLNPVNPDDQFRIRLIDQELADLQGQSAEEKRKALADQKFDELKAIVEGASLNEVLGHPEANKIVHKLLYDQSVLHLQELDKKDVEIQGINDQLSSLAVQHAEELKAMLEDNQTVLADNLKLQTEIEETRKDARFQLNEANRYKRQVESLQAQLEAEKERRTEYKPSGSLQELLDSAKVVTEHRKIKITNVQPVNEKETHFTADSENGEKLTISHYALKAYEQVDRLPMPKEVSDADINQQSEVVQEAAKQAEQFQDVVQGDGAGSKAEDGAEKALEDAEPKETEAVETDTVPYTGEVALQMQINALRLDVDQLLAWKEQQQVAGISEQ